MHPLSDFLEAPIDAVIPWMTSQDPAWQRRHLSALGRAYDPTRHHEHGELRLCLWCLRKFMPWLLTIYVITECSLPEYARRDPGVRAVHPDQLLRGHAAIPTFNSNVVESRMHAIPGLSETFLFGCDDFFVGRPVPKEWWFDASRGLPRSDLRVATLPSSGAKARSGVIPSLRQTNLLVQSAYGPDQVLRSGQYYTQSHQIGLLTKRSCEVAWEKYGPQLRQLGQSRTRSEAEGQQLVSHLLFQLVGARESLLTTWVSGHDTAYTLFGARPRGLVFDEEWRGGTYYQRLREIGLSPPRFFCLNGLGDPTRWPGDGRLFRRFAGLFAKGRALPELTHAPRAPPRSGMPFADRGSRRPVRPSA